jgi:hypothetical protein
VGGGKSAAAGLGAPRQAAHEAGSSCGQHQLQRHHSARLHSSSSAVALLICDNMLSRRQWLQCVPRGKQLPCQVGLHNQLGSAKLPRPSGLDALTVSSDKCRARHTCMPASAGLQHVRLLPGEAGQICLRGVTCVRAPWLGLAVSADGTDGVGTAAAGSSNTVWHSRSGKLRPPHGTLVDVTLQRFRHADHEAVGHVRALQCDAIVESPQHAEHCKP